MSVLLQRQLLSQCRRLVSLIHEMRHDPCEPVSSNIHNMALDVEKTIHLIDLSRERGWYVEPCDPSEDAERRTP